MFKPCMRNHRSNLDDYIFWIDRNHSGPMVPVMSYTGRKYVKLLIYLSSRIKQAFGKIKPNLTIGPDVKNCPKQIK